MESFGHAAPWLVVVFGMLLFILAIVLVISWIILPFAIIGTKPILTDLLWAVRENNRLTRELHEHLAGKPPPSAPVGPGARP